MKFWAVLGSRAAEKKNPPNCHKYAAFWGVFFNFCQLLRSLGDWKPFQSCFFLQISELEREYIFSIYTLISNSLPNT